MSFGTDDIFDPEIPFTEKLNHVYRFQLENNPVYSKYASHFPGPADGEAGIDSIALMPIRAFKETRMICDGFEPQVVFKSSGTGEMDRSTHLVADPEIYRKAIRTEFERHFSVHESVILCYTPGYNENRESSLIWMLNELIQASNEPLSRFLPLGEPLSEEFLEKAASTGKQVILFGAAFGLIDLIDLGSPVLPDSAAIIETGGMKTHRREISKEELHSRLSSGFGVPPQSVHSEYGMCELLSQCYAIGGGWFQSPDWVNVSIRDPQDWMRICESGEEGKIGIIDLANIYSCPFILTDDRGVMDENGRFRVLGRWHSAELRGCNFLIGED